MKYSDRRYNGPRREHSSLTHLIHLKYLETYSRRCGWILGVSIFGLLITLLVAAVVPL